jgi:hypothetical protein
MKNLLASWFRNLTAFDESPVEQSFSIVDPTAAQKDGLSTVVLSVSPSDGTSPTIVSLRFDPSGVKLFEKKYQHDEDAKTEMSAMAQDLNEAASLSKEGKVEEAKKLAEALFEKYKRHSEPLVNEQPTPTMTQASQEPLQYKGFKLKKLEDGTWQASQNELAFTADSIDSVKAKVDNMLRKVYGKKLAKSAGITMQNLFFDTVEEAMDFQKKTKELQGPEGSEEGKPLWEQMGSEEQVAPSNETAPEEDNELAPPSLSFDRIEKEKAKTDKDIGKRIKEQVKTEVESALEQKSASVFGPDQEELVEALRKNGRNWDEIKKIFVKELSYNEDDTAVFLDSIRQKEEGGMPEGLPMSPKPPEDLVSPETHDKLVKEVIDKSEPKPEPLPLADEIARADNAEIRKVAAVPPTSLKEGDKVYVDTDNAEWGRVVGPATILENPMPYKTDILVNVESVRADILVPYQDIFKHASLKKQAINPLQEPPAVGQNPGQPMAAPVEEAPTFDSPVPPSQDTNPEPEFLEAPQAGDRVYVMGDYETGQDGYEGTMVSDYTSRGDEYAVIAKDDGENAEVALHRVVKASQKKVAQVYYEKVARITRCKECGAYINTAYGATSPAAHADHAGTKEDPRSPGDWDDICDACGYGKLASQKKAAKKCPNCGKNAWDVSGPDQALNKCWDCGQRWMDDPDEEPIESEADLEVESTANEDVIRMFINDSFPKDKMPVWGTTHLKITKYPNGWALVNYNTPILYRANGSDVVVFNTKKYSVTTSKIQSQIRGAFAGQPVKETDEAGIYSAIDQSNLANDPEIQKEHTDFIKTVPLEQQYEKEQEEAFRHLHESALKLQAELEHEGEVAIYFHKEGVEKKAAGDSAFESNGWCRVWIQDTEIESDKKYPEILKLPTENERIAALKELARDLAYEALRYADSAAGKLGVQSWYEGLTPSRHDRIDWAALASPKSEEEEDIEFEKEMGRKYGPESVLPEFRKDVFPESSQDPKIEKKAAEPLLGPTGEPLPAKPETPTTLKKHLKAPPSTDREKAGPATTEQAQLVKEVENSLSSLEAIKAMVDQAKAKLNAEIKAIEEKGGRVQIEGELREKVERLSKLVEAVQNQMIYAGDTVVRLVQETKERPFKPSDKWKVEKLTERLSKYEDAAKYLKQAEDGAQHLATSEDIRELYFFPRKASKLSKKANFLDTLDQVYNDVLEALKLIVGSEKEQPTAV